MSIVKIYEENYSSVVIAFYFTFTTTKVFVFSGMAFRYSNLNNFIFFESKFNRSKNRKTYNERKGKIKKFLSVDIFLFNLKIKFSIYSLFNRQ